MMMTVMTMIILLIVVFTEKTSDEKAAGVARNGSCKTSSQLIQRDAEPIFMCCASSELESNASRLELVPDGSVGVSRQ